MHAALLSDARDDIQHGSNSQHSSKLQVTGVVVSLSSRVSSIVMSVLVKVVNLVHVPYHNGTVSARKQIMKSIPCFLSGTASNLSLSCSLPLRRLCLDALCLPRFFVISKAFGTLTKVSTLISSTHIPQTQHDGDLLVARFCTAGSHAEECWAPVEPLL
jgi:hypothetical protein